MKNGAIKFFLLCLLVVIFSCSQQQPAVQQTLGEAKESASRIKIDPTKIKGLLERFLAENKSNNDSRLRNAQLIGLDSVVIFKSDYEAEIKFRVTNYLSFYGPKEATCIAQFNPAQNGKWYLMSVRTLPKNGEMDVHTLGWEVK